MKKPIDLKNMVPTVKVVSASCNMRCRYCYYRDRNQQTLFLMREDVLREVIRKTFEYSENDPVSFVWHGGEPLLAGLDFYQTIVEIQKDVGDGRAIDNRIQSNATLINKNYARFFSENNFNVGVSIDGPEAIHDHCRVFANDSGTLKAVLAGIKNLRDFGLKPGAVSLVNRMSIGKEKEFFNFMLSVGIERMLIKPCYEFEGNELADYSVNPKEYTEFMIKLLDIWLEENNPNVSIRNFEQPMIGILGGKPSLCEFSGKCWLFPTVEVDGSLCACDNFPVDKYYYGNILYNGWEEAFESRSFKSFLDDIEKNRFFCKDCKWLDMCFGCCLQYSFSKTSQGWNRNIFCDSKKEIFSTLERVLK